MNKQTIITIMLALVVLAACKTENRYTISADCTALTEALAKEDARIDSFYLEDPETDELLSERQAYKGGKIIISGTIEGQSIALLRLQIKTTDDVYRRNYLVFLEAGDIDVTVDEYPGFASGTPLNDAFFSAFRKMSQIEDSGDFAKAYELQKEYILEHQNDLTAVPMLNAMSYATKEDAEEVLALIGQCSETVQQYTWTEFIAKDVKAFMERPDKDDMFKDFAVEYDGKTTRFSDYVGKGQYVLVDFWASWCGPCRAEIPNLIKTYNKYKEKDLVVLGVAVNDKPEDTQNVIGEEKIPYPQIINSQEIATDLYGITGIPEIILFAPDGTILARGLRGEDIEKKLAEIFGE